MQTIADKNKPEIKDIVLRADGKFGAKQLARNYFRVVELALPADRDAKRKRNVQLKVSSNLEGVQLNLPPPFSKNKKDFRQLYVVMNIRNADKALLKTTYGGEYEGIFEYDRQNPVLITRGEVRLGGGPAVLPRSDGLRIVGQVRELSLDIWSNLIKQIGES
ncbi:MAG: hypothetical protein AMJ55_06910, partial [Gammaproteobacteria bacterium SG8_15]